MKHAMKRGMRSRMRSIIAAAAAAAMLTVGGGMWISSRASADNLTLEEHHAPPVPAGQAGAFSHNDEKEEHHNEHFKLYQDPATGKNRSLDQLNKQLFFVDWKDPQATVTGLGDMVQNRGHNKDGEYGKGNLSKPGYELKVGSTWTKEITPGYTVTVRVKEFTNILGDPNGEKLLPGSVRYNLVKKDGGNPDAEGYRYNSKVRVYQQNFNGYSSAVKQGLKIPGYSVVSGEMMSPGYTVSSGDTVNIGVTYEVSAVYDGRPVKPSLFFVSGEEAERNEAEVYTTDGTPWELLTELTQEGTATSFSPNSPESSLQSGWDNLATDYYKSVGYTGVELSKKAQALTDKLVNTQGTSHTVSRYHKSEKDTWVVDGLGTQKFGPVTTSTAKDKKFSTPIIYTRGVSEVSAYLVSKGTEAFAIGVMALDEGDAPDSYGTASHLISTGMNNEMKQPYIGSHKADIDEKELRADPLYWVRDDQTYMSDEGPEQLMGQSVEKNTNYTLHHANDGTYDLKILVNPNGNEKSFIKAWVDFNNNGQFDENEGSNVIEATQAGMQTLHFENIPQNTDTKADMLGMRVRTALAKEEIEHPTGMAMSGEVEDFQIQQTIPPRGEKTSSEGKQGETQHATVVFHAYGKKAYELNTPAAIDQRQAPRIVTLGATDDDTSLVVPGQGRYTVTAHGQDADVEFTPEPTFVGEADGITIRRVDTNGKDTGWSVTGQTTTMDGVYTPKVKPSDAEGSHDKSSGPQGVKQTRTVTFSAHAPGAKATFRPSAEHPVRLVDPHTQKLAGSVDALNDRDEKIGTYSVTDDGTITFQPDVHFTGTARAAEAELTAEVGRDKNGQAQTVTARATYTPTVLGVALTPKNDVSEGVQGATQTGRPSFSVTVRNANEQKLEMPRITHYALVDPATGAATDDPVRVPNVGEYSIDTANGKVTFRPVASYVTADSADSADGAAMQVQIRVRATTSEGISSGGAEGADATYTPKVLPLTPSVKPATSHEKQGKLQKSQVISSAPKLPEGSRVKIGVPAYAFDDTAADGERSANGANAALTRTVSGQGTYRIDASTGHVFFQPEQEFVQEATPVRVKVTFTLTAEDGSTAPLVAYTTYTPTVDPLTMKGSAVVSEGPQGLEQKQMVTFALEAGGEADGETDGAETQVKPSEEHPAAFVNPADGTRLEETTLDAQNAAGERVGSYTLDPMTGEVHFQPEMHFTGEAKPAHVLLRTRVGTDRDGGEVVAEAVSTYTPTVRGVTLTAFDATSDGSQGAEQKGTPRFEVKSELAGVELKAPVLVDPETGGAAASGEVRVPNVGAYTLNQTSGEVTFRPVASYVTAADGSNATFVRVRRLTNTGMMAEAVYAPRVDGVTITSRPGVSSGLQGAPQTGHSEFTPPAVDVGVRISAPRFALVSAQRVPGQGSFSVDEVSGEATFSPEGQFIDTADFARITATYVLTAVDGTSVELTATDTYTPTVLPSHLTASTEATRGYQGVEQSEIVHFAREFDKQEVTPSAQYPADLLDETGAVVEELVAEGRNGQKAGTYTLDASSGRVTFHPLAEFTGKPQPARVRLTAPVGQNAHGEPVLAEATGTYTPDVVPVHVTGQDVQSVALQGSASTRTPQFSASVPDASEPVELTYALVDANGQTSERVALDGVGTFTLHAASGRVTFQPLASFVGTTRVTVRATTVPTYGRVSADAVYTATVVPLRVTGTADSSEGPQGSEQVGQPSFAVSASTGGEDVTLSDPEYSFADGSTRARVEGEGTYSLDSHTGKVTFMPQARFVGEAAGVQVRATYTLTAADGASRAEISAVALYTPNVYVKTTFVEEGSGDPVAPEERDAQPAKAVDGYTFVKTGGDDLGNVVHVYAKVTEPAPVSEPNPEPNPAPQSQPEPDRLAEKPTDKLESKTEQPVPAGESQPQKQSQKQKLAKTGSVVLGLLAVAELAVVAGAGALTVRKHVRR